VTPSCSQGAGWVVAGGVKDPGSAKAFRLRTRWLSRIFDLRALPIHFLLFAT
jgi:hypothetical protein